jgi:hypothetical protein
VTRTARDDRDQQRKGPHSGKRSRVRVQDHGVVRGTSVRRPDIMGLAALSLHVSHTGGLLGVG